MGAVRGWEVGRGREGEKKGERKGEGKGERLRLREGDQEREGVGKRGRGRDKTISSSQHHISPKSNAVIPRTRTYSTRPSAGHCAYSPHTSCCLAA